MGVQYVIIFAGPYIALIVLLVLLWMLINRLKIHRRSKRILFVFAILFGFLVVSAFKPLWYQMFKDTKVLTQEGNILKTARSFRLTFNDGTQLTKLVGDDISQEDFNKIIELAESDLSTLKKDSLSSIGKKTSRVERARLILRGDPVAKVEPYVRVIEVTRQVDQTFTVIPILILAYLINILLDYFLWEGALTDPETREPQVPKLLRQISDILVYLIALTIVIALIFPHLLGGFLTTVGTSGAIGAFLAQEPIKQAFTALSLNINKVIKKGDIVEINGQVGTVNEIGWKSLRMLTPDNNLLSVPNTTLTNSIYLNHSRPEPFRVIKINVIVRAQATPYRVTYLLRRAAMSSQYVNGEPKINLIDIMSTRANYLVEVFSGHEDPDDVKGEVLSAIWYTLRREGLHPTQSREAVKDPVERAKRLLNKIPVFAAFTDDEDEELARNSKWERYGWPERLVIQGEEESSLFMVEKGNLEVLIRQEDGTDLKVHEFKKNDIFGEMSLLTGKPRSATVRALNEVLVCKISKEDIQPILAKRRAILEELSHMLAEKEVQNRQLSEEHATEAANREKATVANRLLGLMVNFFKEDEKETEIHDV
ncbi:MAG: mechanosensitive ion channel family protein [Bacteroidota bacterium]